MFLGALLLAVAIILQPGPHQLEKEPWSTKERACLPDQNQDSGWHQHLCRASLLLPGHRAGDSNAQKRCKIPNALKVCGPGGQCGLCSPAESRGLFPSHFQNPEDSILPGIIFIILYSWNLLYYDSIQASQFGEVLRHGHIAPALSLLPRSHKDAMTNCAQQPRIFSHLKILGN